ncbi:dihydroorotase [Thermovenabulum gondwanense]|uniref:Dihydroorotase n=1 Tax=Thermovenabulum gondwanense TaxID=520767 RepID=A0A162M7J1_9FIRM|nr:dihydroorotase [Thermovenabulum gondwanense]KYO64463.1 Dihydroorotase [Thermovenabulum gondwanense]
MKKLFKNARVIDPFQGIDDIFDLLIEGEKIAAIDVNLTISDADVEDLSGKIITPGLIDMHVHFREPGFEKKEDIKTGMLAAAKGGFTAVACMPNTNPPLDNPYLIKYVIDRAKEYDLIRLYPIGCVTKGRLGQELSEIGKMCEQGAVAFSDDGNPISNGALMRRALQYAKGFDKVIIDHCEDLSLSEGGQINEGYMSFKLGLTGIPSSAEEIMVARDVILAKETNSKIHIAHVSTKGSVEIIRRAKESGINVTCEVTPHHLILTEDMVEEYNTFAKVNPPLRTLEDIEALLEGLRDGTIDCIASDHAPHTKEEKEMEFEYAPFGISGIETSLGIIIDRLVSKGIISYAQMVEKMSLNPAKILNINGGRLKKGDYADITIIDPDLEWVVNNKEFLSKGKNTPFNGYKLKGKAIRTIVRGKEIYREDYYESFVSTGRRFGI